MIKFKLIKSYPQFEMPLECHSIADGGYYTNKGDRVYNPENYPEFWEKIVKKDYKVLSFELNKKIFKLDENKNKYFAEDGNYANYVEMLNDNKIISICRLSDGEIFTIGDRLYGYDLGRSVELTMFKIDKDKCLVGHRDLGLINIKNCKKVKQPLFTTKDGVEKYQGDKIYSHSNWKLWEYNITDGDISPLCWFSTKEAAETFILMNKPCLSIKEICPIIGKCNNNTYIDLDKLTEKLKELVKSKL
jgi:hypothetical protein